jgi:hypothetical protein
VPRLIASDKSVFDHPKPQLGDGEVLALLQREYGLEGSTEPLVSERDQNFLVDASGRQYVLKIANAVEDRGLLTLQNEVLAHLARTAPGLGIPRLVRTLTGAEVTEWKSGAAIHAVRLLTYLPGRPFSEVEKTPTLLASLGGFMGRVADGLKGFGHPGSHRPRFLWNLDEAGAVKPWLEDVAPEHRALVERCFIRHETRVIPRFERLRAGVLHQDANDNNLIVNPDGSAVTGLIDFGDMTFGRQINELAVTLAYALLDMPDVHSAARPLIAGYAAACPLQPDEAEVVFDLVAARLAMSVCVSSHRAKEFPDNEYLLVSQAPALRLLARLDQTNPALLGAFTREAAGLPAVPAHDGVVAWLSSEACAPKPVFDFDLNRAGRLLVLLTPGASGMEHAADPNRYWDWLRDRLSVEGARFGIGRYGEVRAVYSSDQYRTAASSERRSQHLGVDLFIEPGTPVLAPLDGRVFAVADHARALDYGPTVILEHEADAGGPHFFTLYGHLAREALTRLEPGMTVAAGQCIGTIGTPDVNGGWAPHLHFQIITDRLGMTGDFPGVGQPGLWPVWSRLSPDPNLILRLAPESYVADPAPPTVLLERRARLLGPSLSISYRKKLKIVRGRGAYLYDHTGRAFLDGVNNVCHVGHAHPRVVEALVRQASVLNTNTRYLHDAILDYAERLGGTFPKPLSVVYLVCSGSEANELALRMARTVTGRRNLVTLDWGYHGHSSGLIDVSPYKFKRQGGSGKPDHVEVATLPDPYRGRFKGRSAETGLAYAASVGEQIEVVRRKTGQGPAAFIAESISGCGGQVVFPRAYLKEAARLVRAAGGLFIADEVQTGFGRVGSHMWAFELQEVVPDIVTLGKPIGNGHPMAAVITTPEIASAFANGMEFFSSFGGNPVSAAVGLAVLDVLEEEQLQAGALRTGRHLKARLAELTGRHQLIGDVRGEGLFLGVELVRNRATLEPATEEAGDLVNLMREAGVLLATDGPFDNVIKIKPPMVFGIPEAEIVVEELDRALGKLSWG